MKLFITKNWYREAQFEFFKNYQDPFFNISTTVEVTQLYNYCKNNNLPFSLACLFVVTKGMNEITEFKLRFKNNKVVECEELAIGTTVLNTNNSFSFCYFPFKNTIDEFCLHAKSILENHKKGVVFEPKEDEISLIHSSILPWIQFTSIKHPHKGDENFIGIPKVVFGKTFHENSVLKISFSVEIHHAFADGFHVALLLDKMNSFIKNLT